MCIKDMITDSRNMTVDRSIDMKLALSRNDGERTAVKCCSLHRSASTPLWKMVLWTLGIIAAAVIILKLMKCRKKNCKCKDHQSCKH